MLIAHTRTRITLGVDKVAICVNVVVLLVGVAIAQRQIQFFRLLASPLRYGGLLLSGLDSLLNSVYGRLFRFRDKYVSHILSGACVSVRCVLVKYVCVAQSARADNYLSVLYFWLNHNFYVLRVLLVVVVLVVALGNFYLVGLRLTG